MKKKKIAIFASGSGTNAENIIKEFENYDKAEVIIVFCNNEKAGVIEKAEKFKVPVFLFNKESFKSGIVLKKLLECEIDFIVLAGFLWLMPVEIIRSYPKKIINIHPALLPKYGGKGMYGGNVHKAVIENKEKESGITIHYVNEEYDKGEIIFQGKCEIEPGETAENVALKVHQLEYKYFPGIIISLIEKMS